MEKEIWKEIKGFPNYMVSSLGNAKSLDRYVEQKHRNGKIYKRLIKGKALEPHKHKSDDNKYYYTINLSRNGKVETQYLHILVAETFLEKENNNYVVDHINRNSLDNTLANLRYVKNSDNIKNATIAFRPDIFLTKDGYYRVRISIDGKRECIGFRKTYEEALELYTHYYQVRQNKYDNRYLQQ